MWPDAEGKDGEEMVARADPGMLQGGGRAGKPESPTSPTLTGWHTATTHAPQSAELGPQPQPNVLMQLLQHVAAAAPAPLARLAHRYLIG